MPVSFLTAAQAGSMESGAGEPRVRRGAGADHSATGATRIAGSLNFKAKYAPAFPRVAIASANSGRLTTVAALAQAGLIAPEPAPPAASRISCGANGRCRGAGASKRPPRS
jgi:hypothetical protein